MLTLAQDKAIFREVFEFYEKYKSTDLSGNYWLRAAEDVRAIHGRYDKAGGVFFSELVAAVYEELRRNYDERCEREQIRFEGDIGGV